MQQIFYKEDVDKPVIARNAEIAAVLGVKPAMVALAWVLGNPAVTAPIVGATKLYQLEDAVAALELSLDDEHRLALQELYKPHAVSGH